MHLVKHLEKLLEEGVLSFKENDKKTNYRTICKIYTVLLKYFNRFDQI
jgi:hypothetical protein